MLRTYKTDVFKIKLLPKIQTCVVMRKVCERVHVIETCSLNWQQFYDDQLYLIEWFCLLLYLYSIQKHRIVCMMVFLSKLSRLMSKYGDVCRPSACPGPRGQRAQDVGVELKMLVLSLSGFLHVTSCFCSTINLPVLDSPERFEIVFEFGYDSVVRIVKFPHLRCLRF